MKKLGLLLLFVFSIVGTSFAADLQRFVVRGTQKYKLDQSGNMTLAGNIVSSGTITNTGGFILPVVSTTSAPSAAGILAVNSAYTVYISTGTGAGAWTKVGAQ